MLSEADLQQAIFTWAETLIPKYPELTWLHAIPNGGKRNAKEAMGLKKQGVKAGIWDIALDVPRGGFHGFKLELKKPVLIVKLSEKQKEYAAFLEEQGYYMLVSNDFDECKEIIITYLEMK